MKKLMSVLNWRLGLMTLIAAFAIMLLGADYPEYDNSGSSALSLAHSLCDELAADMRPEMKKLSAGNPLWVIQALSD